MTATKTRPTLPAFEGEEVAKAAVRIVNAGDGLSEALKIAPKALNMHDEVFYVLRGQVSQVNHKTDKDELLTRLHTVTAAEITEIDASVAKEMLQAAALEIEKAKADADGQLALDAENEAAAKEAND